MHVQPDRVVRHKCTAAFHHPPPIHFGTRFGNVRYSAPLCLTRQLRPDPRYGDNCETSEDDCTRDDGTQTCENKGETCTDCSRQMADPADPTGYHKIANPDCQNGYTCEAGAGPAAGGGAPCASTPCLNGGHCQDSTTDTMMDPGTYKCTCAFDQWYGDNCETSENDCLTVGRGTGTRVTIDDFRRVALETLYGHMLCTSMVPVQSYRVECAAGGRHRDVRARRRDVRRLRAEHGRPREPKWPRVVPDSQPGVQEGALFTPPSATRRIRTGHSSLVESTPKTARCTNGVSS